MDREQAMQRLQALLPEARERFGVQRLRLFGSTARNQARPDSDLDLLVQFDGPATSERYFGLLFLLEDRLGVSIDLVTEKALRPAFRPYVERDAIAI
jgi:predicted nucleotidyltransferase